MSLRAWQTLFISLVMATYGTVVYSVELFGLKPYVSVPGLASVLAFMWWLLHGEKAEEAHQAVQQQIHANLLSDPARLRLGCLILGLVLLGSFLAVYFSEIVVFYTDQDDEIIVYRMKDGEKKHQGYILKSTPLKDRFLTGDHTFVFESQGYETEKRHVHVGKGSFIGVEKRYRVVLRSTPHFELNDLDISWGDEDAPDVNAYPNSLVGQPSYLLRFSIACTSPSPFEIRRLELQVRQVHPLKPDRAWTFPYYGEAPEVGAVPVRGYAILGTRRETVPILAAEAVKAGARLDPAHFLVRLFPEPGQHYDLALVVHWTDLNNQDRSDKTILPLQGFDSLMNWKTLLRNTRNLRVLYNCRLDKLYPVFERMKVTPSVILISDPNASEFFKTRGIRLPAEVAIIPPQLQGMLEKHVPTTIAARESSRLCSFIIIDQDRLLMQDSEKRNNGQLMTEREVIKSIAEEFDKLSRRLLPK